MCEVTSHNFEELLPEISNRIRNAAFIAIDGEFTALTIDDQKDKSRYWLINNTQHISLIYLSGPQLIRGSIIAMPFILLF